MGPSRVVGGGVKIGMGGGGKDCGVNIGPQGQANSLEKHFSPSESRGDGWWSPNRSSSTRVPASYAVMMEQGEGGTGISRRGMASGTKLHLSRLTW